MAEQLNRRGFVAGALSSGLATSWCSSARAMSDVLLRAAAIQMAAELGNVEANLAQVEQLALAAMSQGAKLVILPEMFSSAMGFRDEVLKAIRPIDGAPLELMKSLARRGQATVGGSFLAQDGEDVYNAFFLVSPDGSVYRHDKDIPTYWENCYYVGGTDDGILETDIGAVGVGLCWELIRSKTALRLRDKVSLLVGGSCWWTLSDEYPDDHPQRYLNLMMLKEAAPRMARLLGVPCVHGSHAGRFTAFAEPDLPNVEFRSQFLGETMIVDGEGTVLASLDGEAGAGFVTAEIGLPTKPIPTEEIPDGFWLPSEFPEPWGVSFERWIAKGNDYYQLITKPYLQSGEIAEYEPPYFR